MADNTKALLELLTEVERIQSEEEQLPTFVLAARRAGCTWAQIGAVLGITKQAAHVRYHALEQAQSRPED